MTLHHFAIGTVTSNQPTVPRQVVTVSPISWLWIDNSVETDWATQGFIYGHDFYSLFSSEYEGYFDRCI